MTKRRYARTPALPPLRRNKPLPPTVRRCPSGDYEVWHDGRLLQGGLGSYDEGQQWIKDNPQ